MNEIKMAAHKEQPSHGSDEQIIPQDGRNSLNLVAGLFGGEVVFLKLRGYSSSNKETDPRKKYSQAKVPIDKDWTSPKFEGHSVSDLQDWVSRGGWVGLRIPDAYIVVDVDDTQEGRVIADLLDRHRFEYHSIRTPNGWQFFFKDTGIAKQNVKMLTVCGFAVDYRLQNKGQIVVPTPNTENRDWSHVSDAEISDMPFWFEPVKQINARNPRPITVPILEGSRNDTLYRHACRLKKLGHAEQGISSAIYFIDTYLCSPSLGLQEVETIVGSAMKHNDTPVGLPNGENRIDRAADHSLQFPTSSAAVPFNRTDLGNAQRLVARHGRDLRYCHTFGAWYIWDGICWQYDETQEVERRAKDTVRSIYNEVAQTEDPDLRASLAKHAVASESKNKISAMISLSQSEPGVPVTPVQLDANGWLLNCKNGMADLRTGVLRTHSRDELITKSISIDYNPDATCPTWTQFLEQVMKTEDGEVDYELINFLQKSIGYALTGDISEQVLFFLYGSGRNGKSTFINTIKDLLGDYAKQSGTETFMMKQQSGGIPNDLARLKGARLISAVESEEGKRLAESLIKQLTGGEPITARFLHKEYFEFVPSFKIFFVTNHKPVIKGTDPAIWRRIRLIPFTVTIPPEEVDKKLPDKLRAEMPGILRWAVEGCLKWQNEGLGAPQRVIEATDDYRTEMDTLAHFVSDYCIVNPMARVATADLYAAYKEWCEENGEYVLAKNKFINRLREKMETEGHPIKDFKTNKSRGWTGLGLAANTDLIDMASDAGDAKKGVVKHMHNYRENQKSSVTSVTDAARKETAVGWEEGEL